MHEPKWIVIETVIAIHHRQITEHGGLGGIRDLGLLESALLAPQNSFHYKNPKPNLAELAACYAYSLCKNHPFFDGNKRVSLITCELFLKLNASNLIASQPEKYTTFMQLASGDLTQIKLTKWISQNLN